MNNSYGKKALSGAVWKFAERIAAQGVTTVVGIILARLLAPEHYGVIAIVNIFITICNVFVVTGLGESLIQKKDADELDFSSIFFVNLSMSVILYIILFFSAPYITSFYGKGYETLTPIIRIMGLRLILAAVNSIQHAKISRDFAFKKYFFVTLIGTIVSGVVGITLAYLGFGVWALVAQYMTNTTIDTIMLFIFVRWFPKLQFSYKRAKKLMTYGFRLLTASLVLTITNEFEQFLISKKYSSVDLAYYSKGNTYPKLLANNISTSISSAIFPLLAKVNGDMDATRKYVSKAIQMISFVVFPLMVGMFLVAEDFVVILLTEKWLPCVPYLRLICIFYMISSMTIPNSQFLTSNGYVKVYSRLTYAVRALGLILVFITAKFGIIWIAVGRAFTAFVEYFLKSVSTGKKLGYSFGRQIKDMLPNIMGCALMAVAVIIFRNIASDINFIALFLLEIIIGAIVYILFAFIIKNPQAKYFLNIVKNGIKKFTSLVKRRKINE